MSDVSEIRGIGSIPHPGGVAFRVWAPNAEGVSVIGSFNAWQGDRHPMQAEEQGWWYVDVAEARVGDQYKFLLATAQGSFQRIDPYAREVTSSVGNAIVHDPNFDWAGDDFQLAPCLRENSPGATTPPTSSPSKPPTAALSASSGSSSPPTSMAWR